jgi:hypothetical protein
MFEARRDRAATEQPPDAQLVAARAANGPHPSPRRGVAGRGYSLTRRVRAIARTGRPGEQVVEAEAGQDKAGWGERMEGWERIRRRGGDGGTRADVGSPLGAQLSKVCNEVGIWSNEAKMFM